jgi:CRP-like cAMP-binding protein
MVPVDKLRALPAFAHLSPEVVERLASGMMEEEFAPGAVIFAEGKGGDAVYFIAKGDVIIRKTIDKAAEAYKVIALLSGGEFFGEMALLENLPRSAGAVAQSQTTLFKLSTAEFDKLMAADPGSALKFFKGLVVTLSGRLRQTTREMVAVFEVGRTLVQDLDVRPLAARVLTLLKNSFEDESIFGAFYYWNEFTSEFELVAFEGEWPAGLRRSRPKEDLIFHTMAIKRECILSRDWAKDERFSEGIRADWKGIASFLAAPVVGLKGPVGYMLFGHGAKTDVFISGHRQVVAGVSNLIAPAFENAAWRQEMESKRRLDRAKTTAY